MATSPEHLRHIRGIYDVPPVPYSQRIQNIAAQLSRRAATQAEALRHTAAQTVERAAHNVRYDTTALRATVASLGKRISPDVRRGVRAADDTETIPPGAIQLVDQLDSRIQSAIAANPQLLKDRDTIEGLNYLVTGTQVPIFIEPKPRIRERIRTIRRETAGKIAASMKPIFKGVPTSELPEGAWRMETTPDDVDIEARVLHHLDGSQVLDQDVAVDAETAALLLPQANK